MTTPIAEHVRCGLHSGLPPCCVAWYLTGWRALSFVDERWTGEYEDLGGIAWQTAGLVVRYVGWRPWGYVPCPAHALLGRPVELRPCDCDVDARMGRAA